MSLAFLAVPFVVICAGSPTTEDSFLIYVNFSFQGSEDWLENENVPITGFAWKMSFKRVTTGIHIWDEIFTVKLSNGEEVNFMVSFDLKG